MANVEIRKTRELSEAGLHKTTASLRAKGYTIHAIDVNGNGTFSIRYTANATRKHINIIGSITVVVLLFCLTACGSTLPKVTEPHYDAYYYPLSMTGSTLEVALEYRPLQELIDTSNEPSCSGALLEAYCGSRRLLVTPRAYAPCTFDPYEGTVAWFTVAIPPSAGTDNIMLIMRNQTLDGREIGQIVERYDGLVPNLMSLQYGDTVWLFGDEPQYTLNMDVHKAIVTYPVMTFGTASLSDLDLTLTDITWIEKTSRAPAELPTGLTPAIYADMSQLTISLEAHNPNDAPDLLLWLKEHCIAINNNPITGGTTIEGG